METTIAGYLRDQLGINGDFLAEYRRLTAEDKQDIRSWAQTECEILDIALKSK